MKKTLKLEISRAFNSGGMAIALGIGIIIAAAHVVLNQIPLREGNETLFFEAHHILSPTNASEAWIAGNTNLAGFIYFLILPILAALPFGTSYFEDLHGGLLKGIYVRTPRSRYLAAKYVSVFLSGGAAVTVPLLINLGAALMLLPNLVPNAIFHMGGIGAAEAFCQLYFSHPLVYTVLYLLIDFCMGGMWACIALAASNLSDYKIIVLIVPFFIQLVIHVLCTILNQADYSPVYLAQSGHGMKYWWLAGVYLLSGIAASLLIFRKKGEREDVF